MSDVASHLRIDTGDYDERIRAFVPHYETMVEEVATSLDLHPSSAPTILDLGIGTGALSAACLRARPDASVIGLDSDAAMLEAAAARLSEFPDVDLRQADFLTATLPPCDVAVACISLHHIRSPDAKRAFYEECSAVLRPGGLLVTADCFPAVEPALAARQRGAWLAHLEGSYSSEEAEGHLAAWAAEDTYFPLEWELAWLRGAGLRTEVLWRRDGFAVLAALAPDGRSAR